MIEKNWTKHSDFFHQADVTAVAGSTTEIFSYKLRSTLALKIKALGNYVGSVAAWGNLTWQLCCNDIPIEPFTAQKSQIGQAGIPQEVTMDFIFPPASLLSVKLINSSGVDYVGGIVLKGEHGLET